MAINLKYFHLSFFFYLYSSFCFSQNQIKDVKFGEVTSEEVSMTTYAADSTADAVVLYDGGIVYFEIIGGAIFITSEYHVKSKILKKSALDRGSFTLPVFKESNGFQEFVIDIKGYTYNMENGSIVKEKLEKDMIFREKASDNFYNIKVSMPKVKEGSVIEYKYKRQTPLSYRNNPGTWYFQQSVPVVLSDYKLSVPNYLYYRMLMSGYLQITYNDTKPAHMPEFNTEGNVFRLIMKDIPAFKNEPYITSSDDYISKVDFELASVNWPGVYMKDFSLEYRSLNKTFLESEDFGKPLENTSFLQDIALELNKANIDSISKLKAAVTYIQKNIKYNDKISMYCSNLKKILEKKEGDSGDMNLLLIALLKEMGFKANPVVLSTRSNGRIDDTYAIRKKFNYVVAHILKDNKDFFIDATDPNTKLGVLPEYCLNHKGFLIHPTGSRMVSIGPNETTLEFEKMEATFNEENELSVSYSKSYKGYSAIDMRNELKKETQEKYIENLKKENTEWTITKSEFLDVENIDKPVEEKHEIKLSDFVNFTGDFAYIQPLLTQAYTENPFKAAQRAFPVDFAYPFDKTIQVTYNIPSGYSILEQPKSSALSLPNDGGKFSYMVTKQANKIIVNSRHIIKKSVFSPEEYPFLKEFYEQIIKKHTEQIVLKKI
jgi:hypothetical protein